MILLLLPGFAPAPVNFTAEDVMLSSLILNWDISLPDISPDQFVLKYSVTKLSGQSPNIPQVTVMLNETDTRTMLMMTSQYSHSLTELYPHTMYSFNLSGLYGVDVSKAAQYTAQTAEAGKYVFYVLNIHAYECESPCRNYRVLNLSN